MPRFLLSFSYTHRYIGYSVVSLFVKLYSPMRKLTICWVVAFLLAPTIPASAQIAPNRVSSVSATPDDPQEELRRAMLTQVGQSGSLVLEGAVDPNEYLIGPGDVFRLMIGGLNPFEIPLTVSASGVLPLPEAGALDVGGKTLAEVVDSAMELLESRYVNAPISLSLAQARSFYVHVTGSVIKTGRFQMLPASRVSDVVLQALSSGVMTTRQINEDVEVDFVAPEQLFRPETNEAYKPALRNIQIQHRDGTEELIDLPRYQTTGNTAYNPLLLDGDRINVPAHHEIRESIRISGDVAWPGLYDWRPDDTIASLLDLATGGRPLNSATQFRLMRWRDGAYHTVLDQSIEELGQNSVGKQPLIAGDHLTIYEQKTATALIEGWVKYPGEYRIEGGETTLTQLVELAGGLRDGASTNSATLERTGQNNLIDTPQNRAESQLVQNSTSDPTGRLFSESFRRPFSGEIGTHVAADIAGALSGSSEDIVLYDGDRLIFPRDEGTVLVTGNVPQPGYVTFVSGMTAKYYVDRAGGSGPDADNVYVYNGSSSTVRQGLNEPVRRGDTVFVYRLEQLTVTSRQARSQQVQALVGVLSAAATVTLVLWNALR
ncbi:MAG: hypothetical protein F4Y61_01430 [Rhodothermaceae bacterium]|nr:hypothetical protein [Rhodothermaceae bacterium]